MPVLSEPTAQERKRGRGWLWLLAAVPVLVVLFLVGTTIRPLVLRSGPWVFCLGGEWLPGVPAEYQWDSGTHPPLKVPVMLNGRAFIVTGTYNLRSLHIGVWTYGAVWFKGHPRR